jgi:hypothetical protein
MAPLRRALAHVRVCARTCPADGVIANSRLGLLGIISSSTRAACQRSQNRLRSKTDSNDSDQPRYSREEFALLQNLPADLARTICGIAVV